MLDFYGYFASFGVGLLLGIMGGGGSVLAIPILVYLFSIEVTLASAYSLFMVGATSLVGCVHKFRDTMLDIRVGLLFGIPTLFAKFWVRRWGIYYIPEVLLKTDFFLLTKRQFLLALFAGLIVLAALSMILQKRPSIKSGKPVNTFYLIFLGLVIGSVTGLIGIGGGFLIVPTLYYTTKLPFKAVVGTTLLVISISCLVGFLGDLSQVAVSWYFLMAITSISVLGIFTGNYFSKGLSNRQLKMAFGWLLLFLGLFIIIKELFWIF